MMDKLNVGVVFGGRSVEHDVSVLTGLQVLYYIDRTKYDPIPIYITRSGKWYFGDVLTNFQAYRYEDVRYAGARNGVILPDRALRGLLTPIKSGLFSRNSLIDIDVVVPAIHGTHGEDGTLQGLLEMADIPYTGCGVSASMIGISKTLTKKVMLYHNLPVLDFVQIPKLEWDKNPKKVYDLVENERKAYPFFVKPNNLGSSIGISKVRNDDQFKQALDTVFAYDDVALIENEAQGCIEVNCSVIRSREEVITSVCEQPIHWKEFLTFDDKYMHGEAKRGMEGAERKIPAPISDELTNDVKELAIKSFTAIDGYGLSRIDFFVNTKTDEIYINEINTIPGSFSFYLWHPEGLEPPQVIDKLIEIAIDVNSAKNKRILSFDSGLLEKAAREGIKFGAKGKLGS